MENKKKKQLLMLYNRLNNCLSPLYIYHLKSMQQANQVGISMTPSYKEI